MAQSPETSTPANSLDGYLKNWQALSSMLIRGRSFSGRERNCAFLNLGPDKPFADISASSGLDLIDDGRAVLATDWDRDGDLDFWFTNREGPRLRFLKNQLPEEQLNQWIAFELTGTSPTCNPDAIGAILELETPDKKITRTLTAGDGFMSQSSKRIHFGLGSNPAPSQLTVRWPDGSTEKFPNLTSRQTFKIKQGTGEASPLQSETPPTLAPNSPITPPHTEQARLLLSHRLPSPPLQYVDFQGELQNHNPAELDGPVLLNLWSSTCPKCQDELASFKSNFSDLQNKGLKILALTVDGIPKGNEKPDVFGAKQLVASSNFPFKVGAIDANGARLLTVLNNQIVVRQRPLPLPISFLIDRHGGLAAIYKGSVEPAQILSDLDLLDLAPTELTKHAFPFPSRDGTELFPLGSLDFAQAYLAGDDPDSARKEILKNFSSPEAKKDTALQTRAYYSLGTLEQSQRNWIAATEAYQSALTLSPNQPALQIVLGVTLSQSGEHEKAHEIFATAAKASEKNAALLESLGRAHLQIDRPEEALTFLRKATALEPKKPRFQTTLAFALEKDGQFSEAAQIYQSIVTSNAGASNAKLNLARLLATAPDDQLRDGPRALALARQLEPLAPNNYNILDALASALAETNDFPSAIATAEKALLAARSTGQTEILPKIQAKLSLYQNEQAFHISK